MKLLLQTTIAAVLLTGCVTPEPTAIPKPGTPIWAAAKMGNKEVVLQHIVARTEVDTRNEPCGASSLHSAAWCGHPDIVELILAAEANVNAINFDGETPLDCATNFSQNEIAALLRKHGGRTADELKAKAAK